MGVGAGSSPQLCAHCLGCGIAVDGAEGDSARGGTGPGICSVWQPVLQGEMSGSTEVEISFQDMSSMSGD